MRLLLLFLVLVGAAVVCSASVLGAPYRVGTTCGSEACDFGPADLFQPITAINMGTARSGIIYIYGNLTVDCAHATPVTGSSNAYLEILKPMTIRLGPDAGPGEAASIFVISVPLICENRVTLFSIQSSSVTLRGFSVAWDLLIGAPSKRGARRQVNDNGLTDISLDPAPLGYQSATEAPGKRSRDAHHRSPITLFKVLHDIVITRIDFSTSIATTDIFVAPEATPINSLLVRVEISRNIFGMGCARESADRVALHVGVNVTAVEFRFQHNKILGSIAVIIDDVTTKIDGRFNFWCPCPYGDEDGIETRNVVVAGSPWTRDTNRFIQRLDPYQALSDHRQPLGPFWNPVNGGIGWDSLDLALALAPEEGDEAKVINCLTLVLSLSNLCG